MEPQTPPRHKWITLALVVAGTIVGMMITDLVLPAVPHLPEALGGDASLAQLVLAANVGGACIGLLAFGAVGDRVGTTRLFVGSLLATSVVTLACSLSHSIGVLIVLRAVQGFVASGPAVFAPGIVRAMFDERGAVRAIGVLSSIESLAPALAPIAGVALYAWGGWRLSFHVMTVLSLVIAITVAAMGGVPQVERRGRGSFMALLRDPVFLRYGLSQAAVLGGLLVFVFGMPTVFVRVLGGTLSDFIVMQVCGIGSFIVMANLAPSVIARIGVERVILTGTVMALVASGAQFTYALAGGTSVLAITALQIPLNAGLGLRGPSSFFRAILASHGDDARGSALVIVGILAAATIGTALVSPWIEHGTVPVAGGTFAFEVLAMLCLVLLPRLPESEAAMGPGNAPEPAPGAQGLSRPSVS